MVFLIMLMLIIIWFLVDEVCSYYFYLYLSKIFLEIFKWMFFLVVIICNMGFKNKLRFFKIEKDELYWLFIFSMFVFFLK